MEWIYDNQSIRRLLKAQGLTWGIFEVINSHLAQKGLMMHEGTIVDATIIAAPPSTKNRDKARDPEMRQTRKGKQWLRDEGPQRVSKVPQRSLGIDKFPTEATPKFRCSLR